jgi:hypothetical protein
MGLLTPGAERQRDEAPRLSSEGLDGDVHRYRKTRYPLEEFLEGDTHLEPGEVGAETAMAASAEGEVPIRRPLQDELVSLIEH